MCIGDERDRRRRRWHSLLARRPSSLARCTHGRVIVSTWAVAVVLGWACTAMGCDNYVVVSGIHNLNNNRFYLLFLLYTKKRQFKFQKKISIFLNLTIQHFYLAQKSFSMSTKFLNIVQMCNNYLIIKISL